MKIAVTGASGFVGRHVVDQLASDDSLSVVAASRSPTMLSHPRVATAAIDIAGMHPETAFEALGRPDAVIHLAWDGLPHYRKLHHLDHLSAQYRFLRGLVKSGLRSLVCTGTCFEYGMREGALSEEMVTNPTNPYGFAKDALRRELEFLQTETGFDLVWARLFYMFGAGQPGGSLYSQFTAAGERGDAVFPMSGGEQLRDFLPVRQVARALIELALKTPNAGTVNVCSGRPVSVRALVERWRVARGWNIELALGRYPYPDYEPMAFWGVSSKLDRLLPADVEARRECAE